MFGEQRTKLLLGDIGLPAHKANAWQESKLPSRVTPQAWTAGVRADKRKREEPLFYMRSRSKKQELNQLKVGRRQFGNTHFTQTVDEVSQRNRLQESECEKLRRQGENNFPALVLFR
jgi:hypothetical protein